MALPSLVNGTIGPVVIVQSRVLWLAGALFLASMSIAMAQTESLPEESAGVDIQVTLGFTNTFRLGHWTPVTVILRNEGSDLVGTLEIVAPDGDEVRGNLFTTTHYRAIDLPAQSRKQFRFTVFLESFSRPLEIRVRTGSRLVVTRSIDLRRRFTTSRLILVLSRDADLDFLNDSRDGRRRVLYPHPEFLPDRWQGYDGVSAIVVHGMSLERLGRGQFEAIRKWLARGGILAVSGGPDYSLLRTPRFAELLPATPVGLVETDEHTGDLLPPGPFYVNRVANVGGRVRGGTRALPLVIEQDRGRGRVLYLTFDVAREPFLHWAGMRSLWLDLLRLPPPDSLTSHLAAKPGAGPLMDLAEPSFQAFPSRVIVSLFLALYLVTLLVGCRETLERRLGRWVARATVWVVPLVLAPASYLLFGPLLFPRNATAVVASVVEPYAGSPYADLDLLVGLYANYRADLRLEYQGANPVFRPERRDVRAIEAPVNWLFQDFPGTAVQPIPGGSYSLRTLEGEDVVPFDFRVRLSAEAGEISLSVLNNTGQAVRDGWLVLAGKAFSLGEIPEGADWVRALDLNSNGIPTTESAMRESVAADRTLLMRLLKRLGRPDPPRDRALLVGMVSSPLRLAGDSARWERQEISLILVDRPVVRQSTRRDAR